MPREDKTAARRRQEAERQRRRRRRLAEERVPDWPEVDRALVAGLQSELARAGSRMRSLAEVDTVRIDLRRAWWAAGACLAARGYPLRQSLARCRERLLQGHFRGIAGADPREPALEELGRLASDGIALAPGDPRLEAAAAAALPGRLGVDATASAHRVHASAHVQNASVVSHLAAKAAASAAIRRRRAGS